MAHYRLIGVPLVRQENDFSCWYASVCMVNYCYELGPQLGLPEEYAHSKESGLSNTKWGELAEGEGLKSVLELEDELWVARRKAAQKSRGKGLLFQDIACLLNKYGPIWTVIRSGKHAVVVTGVASDNLTGDWVYYNDPADAQEKKMPLSDLNDQMNFYDENVMLCRPQTDYPRRGEPDKTSRMRASMPSVLSVQLGVYSLAPGPLT